MYIGIPVTIPVSQLQGLLRAMAIDHARRFHSLNANAIHHGVHGSTHIFQLLRADVYPPIVALTRRNDVASGVPRPGKCAPPKTKPLISSTKIPTNPHTQTHSQSLQSVP